MPTSPRGRTKCSVEPRGQRFRLTYHVSSTRHRVPITFKSEEIAYKVASLITEALALDPSSDPWPVIEPAARRVAGITGDQPAAVGKRKTPQALAASITVREYAEDWLKLQVWPNVREARSEDHHRYMRLYILPDLGHIKLGQLSVHDIVALRTKLLTSGGAKGQPLARTSVSNALRGTLKKMIRYALAQEVITRNPFDHELWRTWPESQDVAAEESKADPFTREEKVKLLAYMYEHTRRRNPSFYGYVVFLFTIGCRPSEAAGLQWRDIDLVSRTARIERSFNSGRYARTKTRKSTRTVPLSDELVDILKGLQPLQYTAETPVFANNRRNPFEVDALYSTWQLLLRKAGVRARGIYTCKDTFVVLSRLAGAPWSWIEMMCGVNESTLTRHYYKAVPQEFPDFFAQVRAFEASAPAQPHGAEPQSREVANLK